MHQSNGEYKALVDINAEVARGFAQPDVKQRFATQGFDVVTGTPQALGDYIKLDVARSAKIIQASGMRVD